MVPTRSKADKVIGFMLLQAPLLWLILAPFTFAEHGWTPFRVVLYVLIAFCVAFEMRPGNKDRHMVAGDPSKFVFWKWMDIVHPASTPGSPDALYLRRLYIFRTPLGGLMLHNIRREDWERDALHSHPWALGNISFLTWVIRGGYTEQYARIPSLEFFGDSARIHSRNRRSMRVYAFPADVVHRIATVKPNTWTLVWSMPKPKDRTWGFWVDGKIVKWSEYLDSYGKDGAR